MDAFTKSSSHKFERISLVRFARISPSPFRGRKIIPGRLQQPARRKGNIKQKVKYTRMSYNKLKALEGNIEAISTALAIHEKRRNATTAERETKKKKSFLMKDGTKYVSTSVDDPFKNRDPRLDFTILHHGSRWLNTTLDTKVGGMHNPSGAQYSRTCNYMATLMKDYQALGNYEDDIHLWVIYRYGEVLLNYAEALNEVAVAGGTIDYKEVINSLVLLRKRAGIEPGDDGNYGLPTSEAYDPIEMRDIIRNERRIEMAFEEQRYWDIRRWRIAETVFEKPLRGLSIQVVGTKTNYHEVDVLSAKFDTNRYFYPIPYSELIKIGNMIQNPNW